MQEWRLNKPIQMKFHVQSSKMGGLVRGFPLPSLSCLCIQSTPSFICSLAISSPFSSLWGMVWVWHAAGFAEARWSRDTLLLILHGELYCKHSKQNWLLHLMLQFNTLVVLRWNLLDDVTVNAIAKTVNSFKLRLEKERVKRWVYSWTTVRWSHRPSQIWSGHPATILKISNIKLVT